MKHLGTKQLLSRRCILRPFAFSDAHSMFKWANDVEVVQYLTFSPHKSVKDSEEILSQWIDDYYKKDHYQWAIEFNGIVVGSIGSVDCDESTETITIGYCLNRLYWNQGIMTECLKRVVQFFMEEVGVNRLQMRHDVNNVASGKVIVKAGFHFEGVLKQDQRCNSGLSDVAYYRLLKTEYRGEVVK